MTKHDPATFNAPAVAFDATPTRHPETGRFVPVPVDHRSGQPRLTPARRAELAAKYPSLRDDPQWAAASEPQATDRHTVTYDPRDSRRRTAR